MIPAPSSHSALIGPSFIPECTLPVQQPAGEHTHQPTSGAAPFSVGDVPSGAGPSKHTTYPYVTGTSVLAIKYKDGVMMACDTLAAYGATKRYKSVTRMRPVGAYTVVGATGELSDFEHIGVLLDTLTTADFCADDGVQMGPQEVHAWLNRVMYNRRNKFDPYWNSLVVAGFRNGAPFLGLTSMLGVHYAESHVAAGFGAQLARPLFRESQRDDMTESEARALMESALRVCYYRDKNSINKFQVATATAAGVAISEPFALDTQWRHKAFFKPTEQAIGSW